MICLDTTFLVNLWRAKDVQAHPAVRILADNKGEEFAVPAHAAGEFLEGGAAVSDLRLKESLHFLRIFGVGTVGIETAEHYARIVADLRRRSLLDGLSKADLWIAAWAVEHGSVLVTRDTNHFGRVSGLRLLSYALPERRASPHPG
jgi:predicted nucleic acid-binding protein